MENVTFGDGAKLVVNTTGKFTLTGCTFTPASTSVRTAVTLNVGEAEVTDNTFNGVTNGYYNAIEFGIGANNYDLRQATISGNTFNSAIQNNYFNFYNMTNDAQIDIVNNKLLLAEKTSNGIRISNYRNATGVVFNVTDDEYTYATDSADSEYEGLILLQDYSAKDAGTQDFTGITINVTNLTAPESAKQFLYVYADQQQSIITTNQPVVKGDSSIEKFFAAEVNGTYYKTLADAIAAANDGDTITMLKDAALDKLTEIHPNVTLDLGGKTVSRGGSVLDIYGDVTIKNGTIKTTGTETGAVWMNKTAKLTVEKDVTINPTENSSFAIGYYKDCTAAEVTFKGTITGGNGITMNGLIKDTGTKNKLTVDGAKITVSGQGIYQAGYSETAFSVNNSTISGSTGIEVRAGKLNVTNSTISGSGEFHCVPNGNGGTTDGAGIAIAQHTTKLPIEVTISGGEISGTYAIYESNPQNNDKGSIEKVKLSVTDGKFNGPIYSKDIKNFITGGYFTTAPHASYLAADKAVWAGIEPGYAFMVGDAPATEVKPATAEPSVDASAIAETDRQTAADVASSIEDSGELAAAAVTATKSVSTTKEQAVAELVKTVINATVNNTNIFVQTYLEVKPTAFDAETKTITLDIAVVLTGSEKAIAIQTMTISIKLPAAFSVGVGDTVYIQHKGYEYDAAVNNENGTNIATFTNPHGFSEFTITAESNAAAEVNGTKYTTLQDAVNAVKDGETITVLKDNLSAEVSGNKTFTVVKDNGVENVTLTAASGYTLTNKGNVYTVAKKSSSGGSSSAASTYEVRVDSTKDGTVSASTKRASKDQTVTITVKPDSGYTLEAVTVTDKDSKELTLTNKSNGQYTFKMPASAVTVKATFMEDNTVLNFFYDVPNSSYYYEAVKWAVDKEITAGVGNNLFAPDQYCTRAQIVTFLWRAAGSPEAKSTVTFSDVPATEYYAKAVAWAVEQGITKGTSADTFSPDDTCTRAHAVTFLARARNAETTGTASFTDVPANSYYTGAVAWAAANGITTGVTKDQFAPDAPCTRGQIVTFLFRATQDK